jgi:hypothetical protein
MLIDVYRAAGYDCTNGPSRDHDKLCVTNVEGPFEPSADAPAVTLEPGSLPGIARLVPDTTGLAFITPPWFMFGGNYGASSDSRFSRAVEKITGGRFHGAVAIHDRLE